ncbi:GNAT family N-acetyltransferase [Candidatus Uabimicrobium amorphum]|uniref:N-acetyltransferase n=1 Tax=Uabimicrobium amorphum TaxID=2596890 RepID=A0A5S9IMP7_UABAM|nr:GNAT family N-acetyltransferase [Candidatus Uabimicrobium amorphum]BBM84738.1 N-acetyltransferase [Candidatus Uabimicrobium amorphum]
MGNIWFTSDTHFGHANIIKHSLRPFFSGQEQEIYELAHRPQATQQDIANYAKMRVSPQSVRKHDEQLIANWNARVTNRDRIYHLGDFGFANDAYTDKILSRLNGNIYFLRGNHDYNTKVIQKHCVWVKDYFELKVKDDTLPQGKCKIILLHYALRVWNASHHGSWHLYGHSHNTLPDDPNLPAIDIGVDAVAHSYALEENIVERYRPISYEEIKTILLRKFQNRCINTQRLTLCPYNLKHMKGFITLNVDPIVRKNMDGPKSLRQAKDLFLQILADKNRKCWAVTYQDNYIGHCFLERTSQNNVVELGFLFFQKYWGQGFATETAKALVNYAKNTPEIRRVIASIDHDHNASIGVLQKAGLKLTTTGMDDLGTYYIYSRPV